MEPQEIYEPPSLEEVGEFAELTRGGHPHGTLLALPGGGGTPRGLFDPRTD